MMAEEQRDQCYCRAPDSSDSWYKYTALHIAALSACARCLRAGIREGHDVNALSVSGQTPLFLAMYVSSAAEQQRSEVCLAAVLQRAVLLLRVVLVARVLRNDVSTSERPVCTVSLLVSIYLP
jgi:hypothetical protein